MMHSPPNIAQGTRGSSSVISSSLLAPRDELRLQKEHLIVFADDWGRHPSSAQHLVRHLLGDCAVSWINTIGTRAPQLNAALVRRGVEKLIQWGAAAAPVDASPAPRICSPVMYPGFRSNWQRKLNAHLLARFMRAQFANHESCVVVSTIPIVADLPERLKVRRWVYYCVDDFSVWPGLDSQPLRTLEHKFVARSDRIIAAGENLAARIRSLGREARVISHGIDVEHWSGHGAGHTNLLERLPRPIVLFWGLIDRRLDLAALRVLDQRMRNGTIVLVGPEQDSDPGLGILARVKRPGPAPYESLPALASQADVLLMPYADLPVTRAMQPLKLKEYLATGRPVVSTRLPALAGWEDCLDIVDGPEQFANAVMRRCDTRLPPAQRTARERLQDESWKSKSRQFADELFGS